jgi:hypothetical protein
MICGFCSKEQPYSNEPCSACGHSLTRTGGPRQAFWHGGTGQRVQVQ